MNHINWFRITFKNFPIFWFWKLYILHFYTHLEISSPNIWVEQCCDWPFNGQEPNQHVWIKYLLSQSFPGRYKNAMSPASLQGKNCFVFLPRKDTKLGNMSLSYKIPREENNKKNFVKKQLTCQGWKWIEANIMC